MLTSDDKLKILIVDDNPVNCKLLISSLGVYEQYKLLVAQNGDKAISVAEKALPDLILLDINMPGKDGFEVCAHLKSNPDTRAIPIIFLSALDDLNSKIKGFNLGGVDYITKPFHKEEVIKRVETHLNMQQMSRLLHLHNQALAEKNSQLEDTLVALQNTQSQLVQSEKMAVLGQLVAGVAHEINTPLGAINAAAGAANRLLPEVLTQHRLLLKDLNPEEEDALAQLLDAMLYTTTTLTTREERQYAQEISDDLARRNVPKAQNIGGMLARGGVVEDYGRFLPVFRHARAEEMLAMALNIGRLRLNVRNITTSVAKTQKIVFSLKTYAYQKSDATPEPASLIHNISSVLDMFEAQLKYGVEVLFDYDVDLPAVECFPDELGQLWTNLVQNAIQAMSGKGVLEIEVRRVGLHEVVVHFTDSGPGVPPELQERIFQPFFTTKRQGEGSGLGLDICRKIVAKHCGAISLHSQPGSTTFSVTLPVRQSVLEPVA